MTIDCQQIQQIPLFTDLPEAELQTLTHIAIPVQRRAGDILFYKGDPAPGLYAILNGRVKIAREAPSGREQVLTIAGVGQHFNTVPIFDHGPCPANAQAVTDVNLALFPVDALREAVAKHPILAMALLAECCGYLRQLVSLVDDLALATVQGRLARLLLSLTEEAEHNPNLPPLTQAEMASRIGTVREMVGRTLKVFDSLELISMDNGAITICNPEGLREHAEY